MSTAAGTQQVPDTQQLVQALRQAHAALEKADRTRHEPIAVVGVGCRLPGGANDPQAFWELVQAGRDAVGSVPADRWDNTAIYDPDQRASGRTYTRHGAFIALPDRFDAEFFGISPREAARLDPQQRLLLETAWEALEDAGAPGQPGEARRGAVFVGIGQSHWADLHLRPDALAAIDTFSGTGGLACFAPGRLSHWLGFTGPSLAVDTACSSSLVALHLACQALRAGEADLALAAGVHLHLAPHVSVFLSRAGALAPDGRTKAFDAAADGFGRGEGCVVFALKRLSDAAAAGDIIHGLVRGSAVNHDGAGAGLTVPNAAAQSAVVRAALADARIDPADVGYLETHGTGTVLGDPIEVNALADVFAGALDAGRPLHLGAVKSNIGHLEAAAGLAGVLKAMLVLRHGEIPPLCNLGTPNPHIPWAELPFALPSRRTAWPAHQPRRVAGISAFGMSGTNAHVVIEQAPAPAAGHDHPLPADQLLVLSARSGAALDCAVAQLQAHLEHHPEQDFADVCHTAAARRRPFEHRLALVADSLDDARRQLASGGGPSAGWRGRVPPGLDDERPVFLFTGQGAQAWDMGRELMQSQPCFRATVERCAAILDPLLEVPLLQVLHGPPGSRNLIHRTDFTQPALFTLQVALVELWRSWGVVPAAVVGHSVGEYAAAWAAGVFSMEHGLKLVAERGRLMHALPGNGTMAALVAPDCDALRDRLRREGVVTVAACNSPRELVISGDRVAVRATLSRLADEGIAGRELDVSHAFHSPLMGAMREALAPAARGISYHAPAVDMLSTVDLRWNAVDAPDYWCRQVVEPVDFRGAIEELGRRGHRLFLEIGPRPVLCGLGRASLTGADMAWVPSLRPGMTERRSLLEALGQLFVRGLPPVPQPFADHRPSRAVPLPTYPFQRSRHWFDAPARAPAADSTPELPLAGRRLALPFSSEIRYDSMLAADASAALRDHRVFGAVVVAAAYQLATVLEAAADAFGGGRLRLEDIRFAHALVLPAHGRRRLQVLLQPAAAGTWTFRTLSCAEEDDAAKEACWTCHATGQLRTMQTSSQPRPLPSPLAAAAAVGVETFHAGLAALGFELGPSYRWLQAAREDTQAVHATLAAPQDAHASRLAPGLLDACFQCLSRFWPLPAARLQAAGALYVPFAIDALELFAWPGPVNQPLELRAALSTGDGTANELTPPAQLELRAQHDRLLLAVSGFRFRRADRAGLLAVADAASALLESAWLPAPDAVADPTLDGPWLLLEDRGGSATALAGALRALGRTVETRATVPDMGANAFACVIDLRPLDLLCAPADAAPPQDLLEQAFSGVQSLLRACMAATLPPRLWLVTRGSQPATTPVAWPAMAQAALWGVGAVLAAEHPQLRTGCIDLAPVPDPDEAASLARALAAGDGEDWVALRGRRLVARLQPHSGAGIPASIRPDASYLVTGGFGALGLQVAGWLAGRGARHLVLAGRRLPAGGASARALESLRAQGVQVHERVCDVGDDAAVDALFASFGALPPLRGVVHAAGALADRLLSHQDPEALAVALTPKVAGGWHLHRRTRDMPLDFFVLFASAATLVGARGQSAYAMANSFLDALAQARRTLGLPALSLAWGAWAGDGMAARRPADAQRRWSERGFGMVRPDRGLELLGEALGDPMAQLAVIPMHPHMLALAGAAGQLPKRFAALWKALPDRPGMPAAQTAATEAAGCPPEDLEDRVRQVLADTLGLADPQTLEPRARLFDLGFDSILALEAAERLGAATGIAVHDTIVFEYPTLEALVACLRRRTDAVAAVPAPMPPAVARTLSEQAIAALSDTEAERLLLQQLQTLAPPAPPPQ